MEAHALDLFHAASWAVVVVGGALIAVCLWIFKQFNVRMTTQDKTLKEIRDLLASETRLLREAQHELEVRVTRIEERCVIRNHSGNANGR